MLSDRDYDLISGYLDDALTESERAEVESRLRSDAEFTTELTAMRRTVDLVKALPQLTAPRDFRLTREQAKTAEMSWPSKRGAQMSWPSKRAPIAFRQAVLPVMSAAASVIMVVVGFLAVFSGQATQPPPDTTGSVAMMDVPPQSIAPTNTEEMVEMFSAAPAMGLEGTPPAPINPTSEHDMSLPAGGGLGGMGDTPPGVGGGGGGEDSAEFVETLDPMFLTPVEELPTDDIAPFTMIQPEPTPSPDFDGAARSMSPAPTSFGSSTEESESADTMMFESAPAATDTLMPTQIADLAYDAATHNAVEDTALKAHTAWDGDGISPLAGMILLISGLSLGMASWILWRARQ